MPWPDRFLELGYAIELMFSHLIQRVEPVSCTLGEYGSNKHRAEYRLIAYGPGRFSAESTTIDVDTLRFRHQLVVTEETSAGFETVRDKAFDVVGVLLEPLRTPRYMPRLA